MSTEMITSTSTTELEAQMSYAKAVAVGDLLPQAYRGKPANVLLAIGLGQAMGLSPAESLYRIDVIQGKPTASGELIAANVRKAGHKLRVRVDERAQSVTATIIRADDPDHETTIVRDMPWAKKMGLASKDNYLKQPTTMLQWRAVSAVARLACPEALYGVVYTPDELQEHPLDSTAPERSGAARMRSTLKAHAEQGTSQEDVPAGQEGEQPETPIVDQLMASAQGDQPDPVTSAQLKKMGALMREAGLVERAAALTFVNSVIGREVGSRNELTKGEASDIIDQLERDSAVDVTAAQVLDEPDSGWPEVAQAGQ